MQVNKVTNYEQQVYVKDTADKKTEPVQEQPAAEKTTETKKSDTVSLSAASKELQTAKNAALAAPEEQSSRVDEIKAAIEQGTYNVDAERVADKMLETNISEII